MNKSIWILLPLVVLFFACTHEPIGSSLDEQMKTALNAVSATGSYNYYEFPKSDDFSAIPNQDPKNPVTANKVALGKLLY